MGESRAAKRATRRRSARFRRKCAGTICRPAPPMPLTRIDPLLRPYGDPPPSRPVHGAAPVKGGWLERKRRGSGSWFRGWLARPSVGLVGKAEVEMNRVAPTGNRSQTSLNAETQRIAEKRREKEPSATLCTAIVEIVRKLRGSLRDVRG